MPYNQTAGTYGAGQHRPQWLTLDQVYAGQGGPLYIPPPNPTGDSTRTGGAMPQPTPRPGGGGGGGRNAAPSTPSWQPPPRQSGGSGRTDFGTARTSYSESGGPRVNYRAGGGLPELPEMPQLDFGKLSVSGPVDRSRATDALDDLGRNIRLRRQRRAELGGPGENNEWETMAGEQFAGGFDPGSQYSGYELPDEVFSEGQVNQMAQARAAPTIRAYQDAQEDFARQAGMSGTFSPAKQAALRARAMVDGAGAINAATRDAQLDAAQANAQQKIAKAASRRADFSTDLESRLGLGRLNLDTAGELLGAGLQRRGLDQTRDLTRYEGDISQRGQDYDVQSDEARMNTERAISRAAGEREMASDIAGENLARDRFGLDERSARNSDSMGLGRLGLDRYRAGSENYQAGEDRSFRAASQNAELENSARERRSRLAAIDAQLQDSGMDRNQRAAMERERMSLQRDLADMEASQRQAQFEAELGLRRDQFGENQRQFDTNLEFERDTGVRQRDLQREMGGRFGPSAAQVAAQNDQRSQLEAMLRQLFEEQMRRSA